MAVGYPLLASSHQGVGAGTALQQRGAHTTLQRESLGQSSCSLEAPATGQDLGQNNPDRPCGEGLPQRQ